jgi:hypothetical protein
LRIRLAIPDRLVTPAALEAALEATALANEQAVIRGEVPGIEDAIRKGIRWRPEPYLDGEHFDLAHQVVNRKWGDCDDLAPWLAGELRASGEDPGARPRVYKTGPQRWHVVTELSDGTILDPSKWAGMGKKSAPSSDGIVGMIARPFARPNEGALACVPHHGRWWARCDLPFPDADAHLASHARAGTPDQAIHNAISGAVCCGESIDSPLTDRARYARSLLLSGADEVGSLFGGLAKMAASAVPGGSAALQAAKMAKGLASHKKPSAATALAHGGGGKNPPDATHHPSGSVSVPIERSAPEGHSQHMMLMYHPAWAPGPVVMRF